MKKNISIILALVVIAAVLCVPVTAKEKEDPLAGPISDILTLVNEMNLMVHDILAGINNLQTTMDSNFTEVDASLAAIDGKLGTAPSGSHGPVVYHTGPVWLDTTEHVEIMCLNTNETGTDTVDMIFSQTLGEGDGWTAEPHSEIPLLYNYPVMTTYVVDLLHSVQKVDIKASSDSIVCTVCYPTYYGSAEKECYKHGDFSVERES
jgi:hypothetical protein